MGWRVRAALLGAAGFLSLVGVAQAAEGAKCDLKIVATLPVAMRGLSPVVTTTLNGHPATLEVDTGAFYSAVSADAVDRFGMRRESMPFGLTISGATGEAGAGAARAESFGLGEALLRKMQFLVLNDFRSPPDGLLGQNILGQFEAEFDFSNGVVRLLQSNDCGLSNLAYWAKGEGVVLPMEPRVHVGNAIVVDAQVNGRHIFAGLDTGAGPSILSLEAARRIGISVKSGEADPEGATRGVGARAVDAWRVPIGSFELGGEAIRNTRLTVADMNIGLDMLLGADFFLSHRVLVSYKQRRVYFTYSGGPIFRLGRDGANAPIKTSAPGGAGGSQKSVESADVLRAKAAAALSRGDEKAAVQLATDAIAADPKLAEAYVVRATANGRLGHFELAEADATRALELRSGDVQVLLLRARSRLSLKRLDAADSDIQAAIAAAPESQAVVASSSLYIEAGHYGRAIRLLDGWLAKHPRDAEALNGRCWALTVAKVDLDKALADCNLALRSGAKVSTVYDSRGYAHLRRGEVAPALADFNAALKLQPRLPSSLLGRGLARRRLGDEAAAETDFAAAKASDAGKSQQIQRELADLFARP